jgi:SOS response regulatory protein OraA/RecX
MVKKRRLVAFLVRRGFAGAEVRQAVEALGS